MKFQVLVCGLIKYVIVKDENKHNLINNGELNFVDREQNMAKTEFGAKF